MTNGNATMLTKEVPAIERKNESLGMTPSDDLFSTDESRAESQLERS